MVHHQHGVKGRRSGVKGGWCVIGVESEVWRQKSEEKIGISLYLGFAAHGGLKTTSYAGPSPASKVQDDMGVISTGHARDS